VGTIPLTTAMIASEMRSCLSPACDDTGQTNTIVASREGFGPGARYVLSLPGAHWWFGNYLMSVSAPRQRLPNRRSHWLYGRIRGAVLHGGIGRFDDGRIAEIFINGAKVGSTAEANAQDAAIVASLALQHGCR